MALSLSWSYLLVSIITCHQKNISRANSTKHNVTGCRTHAVVVQKRFCFCFVLFCFLFLFLFFFFLWEVRLLQSVTSKIPPPVTVSATCLTGPKQVESDKRFVSSQLSIFAQPRGMKGQWMSYYALTKPIAALKTVLGRRPRILL